MSTFLNLCQEVARESGTVKGDGLPATLTGLTGRLLRIKNWVRVAHNEIQALRPWRWLEGEFEGYAYAGKQRYTAADLFISERFDEWIPEAQDGTSAVTCQLSSEDRSSERRLTFLPWRDFRTRFMVGTQQTGRPAYFSVDPDDQIVLAPIPEAECTIRGLYRKAPFDLTKDTDEPEIPASLHQMIVWRALLFLINFDEEHDQFSYFQDNYSTYLSRLVNRETPMITTGGPLA